MACSDSEVKTHVLTVTPVGVPLSEYSPEIDGLKMNSAAFTSAPLSNSETLSNLSEKVSHLSMSAQADIKDVIKRYPSLFSDFSTTTQVLT